MPLEHCLEVGNGCIGIQHTRVHAQVPLAATSIAQVAVSALCDNSIVYLSSASLIIESKLYST